MDSNISDLLGGVLSNPDMMDKVKTLLPLVSQMVKPDGQAQQPAPIGHAPPPQNIMADANVAAALQNLIAAISAASQPPAVPVFAQQPLPEAPPEPTAPQETSAPPPAEAPAPAMPEPPAQAVPAESLNIEKVLSTLQSATTVANPENDNRAKLLLSLKPFLGEARQVKIDTAIKYINAAKIFSMFGKNGFVK